MNSENDAKLLCIGLAKKAGALVTGTEMVCEALRTNKKISLVICSESASDNTRKKVSDKCAYYKTELIFISASPERLGGAVGKKSGTAVVAVSDSGLAELIKSK